MLSWLHTSVHFWAQFEHKILSLSVFSNILSFIKDSFHVYLYVSYILHSSPALIYVLKDSTPTCKCLFSQSSYHLPALINNKSTRIKAALITSLVGPLTDFFGKWLVSAAKDTLKRCRALMNFVSAKHNGVVVLPQHARYCTMCLNQDKSRKCCSNNSNGFRSRIRYKLTDVLKQSIGMWEESG